MNTETLTYEADGLHMISYLYYEDSERGPRPGVLVFPEAFGLGDHARSRAEQLAKTGYIALACDLHGDGRVLSDLNEAMPLIGALRADPSRTRARAAAAFETLRGRAEVATAQIAAIGFCFGGTMALELARSGEAVAGVVGFHSGLATVTPQDAKNIRERCWSASARMIPAFPLSSVQPSRKSGDARLFRRDLWTIINRECRYDSTSLSLRDHPAKISS